MALGLLLEENNPEAAQAIRDLPWVTDGLTDAEEADVVRLLKLGVEYPGLFAAMISEPWVQDGIAFPDDGIISNLTRIAAHSNAIAVELLVATANDSDNPNRFTEIRRVRALAEANAVVLEAVWQQPWYQDGLDTLELAMFDDLTDISEVSPDAASLAVESLLSDSITPEQADQVRYIRRIADSNPQILTALTRGQHVDARRLQWATEIAEDLAEIYRRASFPPEVGFIESMPFLETIDSWDVAAVESMRRMIRREHLSVVLEHPAIQDGINDDEAKVVATLRGVMRYNPGLLDVLLDPQTVILEERVIELPLAGTTLLTIIRTRPGSTDSMEFLEHAVRSAEEFMGIPFPTNYVALLFADAHNPQVTGGYFGTHAVLNPLYERRPDILPKTIAHEFSHYYWHDAPHNWFDEGASEFLSIISEHMRIGRPIQDHGKECQFFSVIGQLEDANPAIGTPEFGCNYTRGRSFFLYLHSSLGGDVFRQGFRKYYLSDTEGIHDLIAAFKITAPGREHSVDLVIAKHYGPLERTSLSTWDLTPPDPGLPTIKGTIESFYVGTESGSILSKVSAQQQAVQLWLHLTFSHDSRGQHELPLESWPETDRIMARGYTPGNQG